MKAFRGIWTDQSAAVAPTVALSMVGLIAMGGIAFDFAHLATLDTELQQAADQAALAGAGQLDRQTGACSRAAAAASAMLANHARLGDTLAITVANEGTCDATGSVRFYQSYDATSETYGSAATSDANARVIEIDVNAKKAVYALTPVVGAFNSGNIAASAMASMTSSICKEPPVMMCNPSASPGSFDYTSYLGKGIVLTAKGNGGSYVPGNFGFLDVGAGASDLSKLMGYAAPPGGCVQVDQPVTQPGAMTSVINEFNTRFDIYESGDSIGCFGSSLCPPAINSRKDVLLTDVPSKNNCGIVTGGGKGWKESTDAYRPGSTDGLKADTCASKACGAAGAQYPDVMGYPRDRMHAFDSGYATANRIGDGDWDRDAYFRSNYGWTAAQWAANTGLSSGATRYQVYQWEMANRGASVGGQTILGSTAIGAQGTRYGQPVCRPGLTGSTPAGGVADRRLLPVAVVNCTGLTGAKPVNPIDWIEVFLVEPSMDRKKGSTKYTDTGDIYVEVVGRTLQGTGGTASQFVRHDKPFLIK